MVKFKQNIRYWQLQPKILSILFSLLAVSYGLIIISILTEVKIQQIWAGLCGGTVTHLHSYAWRCT